MAFVRPTLRRQLSENLSVWPHTWDADNIYEICVSIPVDVGGIQRAVVDAEAVIYCGAKVLALPAISTTSESLTAGPQSAIENAPLVAN